MVLPPLPPACGKVVAAFNRQALACAVACLTSYAASVLQAAAHARAQAQAHAWGPQGGGHGAGSSEGDGQDSRLPLSGLPHHCPSVTAAAGPAAAADSDAWSALPSEGGPQGAGRLPPLATALLQPPARHLHPHEEEAAAGAMSHGAPGDHLGGNNSHPQHQHQHQQHPVTTMAVPSVAASPFTCLTGRGDSYASVQELVGSLRPGLHISPNAIPVSVPPP